MQCTANTVARNYSELKELIGVGNCLIDGLLNCYEKGDYKAIKQSNNQAINPDQLTTTSFLSPLFLILYNCQAR
jgi:hypothetical protein